MAGSHAAVEGFQEFIIGEPRCQICDDIHKLQHARLQAHELMKQLLFFVTNRIPSGFGRALMQLMS